MSTGRREPDDLGVAPVHVLVVAYGDPDALEGCLGALEGRYPVVVVDNSSSADDACRGGTDRGQVPRPRGEPRVRGGGEPGVWAPRRWPVPTSCSSTPMR